MKKQTRDHVSPPPLVQLIEETADRWSFFGQRARNEDREIIEPRITRISQIVLGGQDR